jgi:hypothetical protein
MLRKAILIGVPNCKGQSELPGVRNDIQSFQKYLKRNESGAWDEDEIIVLENKSKSQILETIKRYSYYDYVILLAAGHGAVKESYNFDTVLYTGQNEFISSKELEIDCDRQTIIMDVCRAVHYDVSGIYESIQKSENIAFLSYQEQPTRAEYKRLFNNQLLRSPKAYFKFYSCDKNEGASDHPSYTQALLKAGESHATKSILKTHNNAVLILKDIKSKQNPTSETGRTLECDTPIFSIRL